MRHAGPGPGNLIRTNACKMMQNAINVVFWEYRYLSLFPFLCGIVKDG